MATLAASIEWGSGPRGRVGGAKGERRQGSRQYRENGTGTPLFVIILCSVLLWNERVDIINKTCCVPSSVFGSRDNQGGHLEVSRTLATVTQWGWGVLRRREAIYSISVTKNSRGLARIWGPGWIEGELHAAQRGVVLKIAELEIL